MNLVLYLADSIFKEEKYEYRRNKNTQDLIDKKEAIIFGFTACIYRERRKNQELGNSILNELLTRLPKKLNDLLKTTSDALGYSHIGRLNWDNLSWSNSEGILGIRSGTITTDRDIVLLLLDRLFFGFKNNLFSSGDIDPSIKNELLAIDNQLADKNKGDIYSCSEMTEEEFVLIKEKILNIFKQIKTNYENNTKEELIKQNINVEKVKEYALENQQEYAKNS